MARVRASQAQLQEVLPLLPPALRATVQSGPVEDGEWCLLVQGNAAAAKLRQLQPMMLAHLRTRGWNTTKIRIKLRSHG